MPRLPPIASLDYPPFKKARSSILSASSSSLDELRRPERVPSTVASSCDRDNIQNTRGLSSAPAERHTPHLSSSAPTPQPEGAIARLLTVRSKDEWKRHTVSMQGADDVAVFKCVWQVIGERPCGYTAKRHLVKRHVETRHLQIKFVRAFIDKIDC